MGLLRASLGIASLFGMDFGKLTITTQSLPWFWSQKRAFAAQYACSSDRSFAFGPMRPCLVDRFERGGAARGMYFYQDLLVAQLVYEHHPMRHVDIGSRVDGFVAHVATFCQVEVLDIRPNATKARNITFCQVDIMHDTRELHDYADSVSCLNALEHFGLGRYGDPIDCDGHRKGFVALARMVKAGGWLYFSVPISIKQRLEFNAHRLFSMPYLLALFEEFNFDIESFHYVDDDGELQESQDPLSPEAQVTYGLNFGCGIFELKKRGI